MNAAMPSCLEGVCLDMDVNFFSVYYFKNKCVKISNSGKMELDITLHALPTSAANNSERYALDT